MLPEIKTILYATDLGPGARYVFGYALALARHHQARLVALHAIRPLSSFAQSLVEQYISHDESEEVHIKARENVKAELKVQLESLCARECNGDAGCQDSISSIRVVDGFPAWVILDTANECSADLIVVGAHSHTVVGEVMLGSTARKVVHTASQPVLVVKIPKGYKE